MRRASLIFATRRPPFPLDNGARIRAHRLASGLSEHFDLTLVTFDGGPTGDETTSTRADLERVLPAARIELVPFDGRAAGRLRRDALRATSASWGPFATRGLRERLKQLASRAPGSVLHLDDPGVGLAGVGLDAGLVAFAPHNIEYRVLRGVAPSLPLGERPFVELEWRKGAREERRLWRRAQLCVAVSELDARVMREEGAAAVVVCPNGTDPVQRLPLPALAEGEPLRLLFVGSGAYWPYQQGLAWFVAEVLPLARHRGPVALEVVGERPPDPARSEGVVYRGRVPDVHPFYERAHALVLPVFAGSGTRLKVLEAAALGRPIISTALGAEGLPLEADKEFVRAENAEEFAAAIASLRESLRYSPEDIETMVAAARHAAEPFNWEEIVGRLAETYVSPPRGR
jgi:glycosyltransferase involved in cell wall biosynthesis